MGNPDFIDIRRRLVKYRGNVICAPPNIRGVTSVMINLEDENNGE